MLPLLLKFRPSQGPHRHVFVDPDTGHEYIGKDRAELVRRIVSYRSQNQLPAIENLDLVLDHYLCTLPENAGRCTPIKSLKRGLWPTIKGGIALLQNIWYDKTVTQEEADRRSDICVSCKYNIFPGKPYLIRLEDKLVEAMVGDKKTKNHSKLGNCEVCTCVLRAKTWFDGNPELSYTELTQMREVGCWQPELQAKYKDG